MSNRPPDEQPVLDDPDDPGNAMPPAAQPEPMDVNETPNEESGGEENVGEEDSAEFNKALEEDEEKMEEGEIGEVEEVEEEEESDKEPEKSVNSEDSIDSDQDSNFGNQGFEDSGEGDGDWKKVKGRKKEEEERIDGIYLVCQVQENFVVGIKKSIPRGWPYFIGIKDELITGERRKLQVGDSVIVKKFQWNNNFRYLAAHESEVAHNRKFWLNKTTGLLPRQAEATEIECVELRDQLWKPYVGIIYHLKRKVETDPDSMLYAEVACCGLVISSRFWRRQMDGIAPKDLELGQLVTVMCLPLHSDDMVESRYILPAQFPYKIGTERLALNCGALAMIRPHELAIPFPIFPLSQEINNEQLECAEHVLAAASQVSMEMEYDRLMSARFEGSAIREGREFVLVFPPKKKRDVHKLADAWEVENLVKACAELGEKHFAQGEIVGTTSYDAGNGLIEFRVHIILNNVQPRKKDDVEAKYEAFVNGAKMVVFPIPSLGAQRRVDCFKDHCPSALARKNTPAGRIMQTLLGRPSDRGWKMSNEDTQDELGATSAEVNKILSPTLQLLNERQRTTTQKVLSADGQVVVQQAPPGTGKTTVAATAVKAAIENNPDEQVAVLSCSNLPITKLVEEVEKVSETGFLEKVGAIALFAGTARVKYASQINAVMRHTLKPKIEREEFKERLNPAETRLVEAYLENYEKKPRFLTEKKTGMVYQERAKPGVIFCSAAIAENMLDGLIGQSTILIFDESTQASWALLVHLVSRMPKLKTLLLTGDKRQIGVHLLGLPEMFQGGYGLESVIEQVEISPGITYTYLTQMYRAHPFLVNCISYAAYEPHGERLIAATPAEKRSLVTGSTFPLPTQECPIGLIHAFSSHRTSPTSESLTDDHQTEVADFLVRGLLAYGFESSQIVVLCMYTYQQQEIDDRLEDTGVSVVTVDAYQARECDIEVLVTTRSRIRHRKAFGVEMGFFREDRRATVALSRARHFLFLIGDLVAIAEGRVWKRFIERALTRTQPVGAKYAEDVCNMATIRLPSGPLTGSAGPLAHPTFAADWAHYHGGEQPTRQVAQLQHMPQDQWPALPQVGPGPMRRGNDQAGQRGRGRDGPRGWIHYAGNPKNQKGRSGRDN